jgi:putative ABC transport system permease protein
MLKNYFKVAFRNIMRKKLFSFINIMGFTVAISCSLIIFCGSATKLVMIGLISFITERKTKEIWICKVLRSSILGIVSMLSIDFIKWVTIASAISYPITYYFMNKWLQDFAYRIEISWWMFALFGGIASVTVSFQALKAAIANPVESLKYE